MKTGELGGDPAYDGTFWKSRTPGEYAQRIVDNHIPALLWSGWNDIFTRTSQEIGQEVLARVAKWGRAGEDDRTVVIVKALPA